jgi:hypothetical protein
VTRRDILLERFVMNWRLSLQTCDERRTGVLSVSVSGGRSMNAMDRESVQVSEHEAFTYKPRHDGWHYPVLAPDMRP